MASTKHIEEIIRTVIRAELDKAGIKPANGDAKAGDEDFVEAEGSGIKTGMKKKRGGRGPGARIDSSRIERIRDIIRERPTQLADLIAVTGWPKNEIGPILTNMQRNDELVLNMGKGNHAYWFLPDRKIAEQILDRLLTCGVRTRKLEEIRSQPQ